MALTAEGGRRKWERNFPAWLEKAVAKHAGKYAYDLTMGRVKDEYGRWKVRITCPEHGDFYQNPEKHLFGQGCPQCVGRGTDKSLALRRMFPDFVFPNALFVKLSNDQIALDCPEHGAFRTTYSSMCAKASRHCATPCSKCNKFASGLKRRKAANSWAAQVDSVFGGRVSLVAESVTVASDKAEFVCKDHGKFISKLQDVVRGHGCPRCGQLNRNMNIRLDFDEFLSSARLVHGDRYEYNRDSFLGTKVQMEIVCRKHGAFHQRPNNHVFTSAGCPLCACSVSSGEQELREWIEETGVKVIPRDRNLLNGKEIDIYLPEQRLGVEYCGLYWHGENRKLPSYHKEKLEMAEALGIRLVTVFEDEWLEDSSKIKARLLALLGAGTSLMARRVRVQKVKWGEAKAFLDHNHMQGAGVPAKACYGLFNGDQLISVATFGISRFSSRAEWELLRFASAESIRVVGGMGKMFSAFIREYSPTSVMSYADRRWGTGGVYEKLGFVFDGNTKPGYFWCKGVSRFNRYDFQKHKLEGILKNFDPKASEAENCIANGYWRIYDCGHSRWVWRTPAKGLA